MEEEWKRVGGLEHGWREGRGGVDKGVDEGGEGVEDRRRTMEKLWRESGRNVEKW